MNIVENEPSLWRAKMPRPDPAGHKYGRGVAVIYGAPKMTGATRLAARACARMGAGLVKVIAPQGTGGIYRSTLSEEIIVDDDGDSNSPENDAGVCAVLMGSGCTPHDVDAAIIARWLTNTSVKAIVLDAGAFAAWQGGGDAARVVVTPHEGEFAAKFASITGDKTHQALTAANTLGATMVLKGAQTVIAGKHSVVVQNRAVPELATAGTGDVLAGMITGLIAQGMDVQWASTAAVWIHAEAASRFGQGMVASDLPEMIPAVLQDLS